MPLPADFLTHLQTEGYHPRSDKHSNSLGIAIARDLADRCDTIRSEAHEGLLVYDLNFDIHVQNTTWNIDLVIGPPAERVLPENQLIARGRPATIRIALEFKAIMTEHGKARKNRKRDLEAHHSHVHNYDRQAIAGGVFVINQSQTFRSPLRRGEITIHGTKMRPIQSIVESCIGELRGVSERQSVNENGLDTKCAIVVEVDNVNLQSASFVQNKPAPLVGDPLNYDSFLQRTCTLYEQHFARG